MDLLQFKFTLCLYCIVIVNIKTYDVKSYHQRNEKISNVSKAKINCMTNSLR